MLDVIRRLAHLRSDAHTAVAVNVGEPHARSTAVSVSTEGDEMTKKRKELTDEELERQEGEPLPERTQMSVLYPGPAHPWPDGAEISGDQMMPSPTPGPVEE
jgi:hypothetical protein